MLRNLLVIYGITVTIILILSTQSPPRSAPAAQLAINFTTTKIKDGNYRMPSKSISN